MTSPDNNYVVPDHMASLSKSTPLFIFLVTVPIGAIVGALHSREPLDGAFGGGVLGFFFAIPLVIVFALIRGTVLVKKMKNVWSSHTYQWYRDSFPKNAHDKGRVSCRHCGGDHIQVRNLMNHTFTRAHSCAQCGETLYFSAEKV